MIDLAFEYFLKVFVFVIILRALKVFDLHSVMIYVLFCSLSFFAAPTRLMPEFLIFCIFLFLFLYVILVSLRNSLKTGFLRFLRHVGGLFYSKKDIFYSVFLICFFMMASGVDNWVLLFFGSFLGFLFLSWAVRRVNVRKYDKYSVFSCRNAAIVSAIAGLYYSQFVIMLYSIVIGLVYLALFVVFSFVSDTFTFECPLGGLKEGM
ncbi:MAG: hypothetical protein U9Q92_01835, partial [archaeon]|nr:hypothetical protein [archaeon]